MMYKVSLRVSHRTPSGEVWEASGHGVTVKSKNPESAWALAALDAGLQSDQDVIFINESNLLSIVFRGLEACAAPSLKAREYFSKITTKEAG